MPLEAATFISGLNASNPVGVSDPKSQGDDHLRLIKSTLLNSFPGITGAVTATHTELNLLAGASVTGSGAFVKATSPALVTPNLGIPSALTLTNASGLPIAGISGLASGVAALLAAFSSANLAAALTDETGTGANVFATAPAIASPTLSGTIAGTPSVSGAWAFNAKPTLSANGVAIKLVNTAGAGFLQELFGSNALDGYIFTSAAEFILKDPSQNTRFAMAWTDGAFSTGHRMATSSETSGSLTNASANKRVNCSGNITLPASGMTAGDVVVINPAGSARTITRPGGHTMYINDVDSATGTSNAHNVCAATYHGGSKWTIEGAVL